ncbi:MAG TPA: alpha-L-arabinofuranosidase C-terminal domain-containing protein [Candidatus Acidoferrum sp.]|nr:alpha-L-arabinofuranosidase C-terminal domain-containing protein [Candidatus Acidoferrum sp.]
MKPDDASGRGRPRPRVDPIHLRGPGTWPSPPHCVALWCVAALAVILIVCLVIGSVPSLQASEPITITIRADQPGAAINPAMWGVFFEDINFGADGGLYAELVKNRSFEFPDPLMGWSRLAPGNARGNLEISTQAPFDTDNPHYLRITSEGTGLFGVSNEGFHGMGVRQGETYDFSARIRAGTPDSALSKSQPGPTLSIALVGADGKQLAAANLRGFSTGWKKYSAKLQATATDPKARFNLLIDGKGALELDMVSVFPRHTWKNRSGGLRADFVEKLAALQPGFVRFPGGCIVEGRYLTNRYQWKNTIGAPEKRKLMINRWNDEFKHRPAPDYFQSFGLGFFEFFQLCEDIGAEPLPILNCGMACQFNSGELAPLDQLEPYIQDALDLVEFANGLPSSPWGARRAAMGHPAPFNLKLLGVGNEQWGPQYFERYVRFATALKQRYPEIQLVSSAGPSPADERFKFAWGRLRELNADIVDEHCYAAPAWFLQNATRYDNYDRTGPKVFTGEYAAQSVATVSPDNRNNLECALAEAAYMTGLERNADVVRMASYAPLFAHVDGWQWTPDLIWCDNLRVYGTPNYYVQQLFSRNRGEFVLPTRIAGLDAQAGNAASSAPRLFASAAKAGRELILKVVNPAGQEALAGVHVTGSYLLGAKGTETVLAGTGPADENSFESPARVAPVTSPLEGITSDFQRQFKPYSLTVLRLEMLPP